ncbi:hypothetical protein JX266_014384, partial [Neoarthrinium moseri]
RKFVWLRIDQKERWLNVEFLPGHGSRMRPIHKVAERIIDEDSEPQTFRVTGDEYEEWLKDEDAHVDVEDPFQYWCERRTRFPRLSQMALDFLTIQPMSADCERLFSSAGQMKTPQRTALDAVILSICQCLRSWFRAGVIDDLDPILMPIRCERQKVATVQKGHTDSMTISTWLNAPQENGIFDIDDEEVGGCVGGDVNGTDSYLSDTAA